MHAGFEQRALHQLSAPAGFVMRRQVHQLPHLKERQRCGTGASQFVPHGAEDRHLPKFVIDGDLPSCTQRGVAHAIGLGQAGHKRFLAHHVRTGAERPNGIVAV